ncbi:FucTC [Drosophila busckii]|uniref:Fucosyltransferase n=1 Tax=Drosophila busckii TaxID=30019 RepID=A0A0M4EKN2_DROBS|nr:alpha-(1,3)-fucosyltransferase C [Drosophila busckii]ALC50016.1 FucTC [Drosophila busckii]
MRLPKRLPPKLQLLLLLLLAGLILGIYQLTDSPLLNQYGILKKYLKRSGAESKAAAATTTANRRILLWSSFFEDARWKLPYDTLGPQEFRDELQCGVYQCELSNQHDYLPALELYDAIVFHAAQPFPLLKSLPKRRNPSQLYVFALLESPGETKHRLSDEQDFYNLTMSYRLDSDIVWPYARLLDKQTRAQVAPSAAPHWRQPPAVGAWNDSDVWRLWPTKSKMAAWFVSHCETLSLREKLAAALEQHLQLDIYGKCGKLSCARGDPHCDNMLDTDYKFYLAFENSLCEDYVTEKLYGALQRNIVPVVFGGADYTRFLPPHSYIDAEQFESVDELAAHMDFVASDVYEYMSYFWWREHYSIGNASPFCDLCAKLHATNWLHKRQAYADIEAWWFNSCRFSSRIRF